MVARFRRCEPEDIGVPAIVRAELLLGVLKSGNPERTRRTVEEYFAPYELLPFDGEPAGTTSRQGAEDANEPERMNKARPKHPVHPG